MNVKSTKKKNQVVKVNVFEQQELLKKAEVIKANLSASTWRELETNGKFGKNAKLSFISDDMLILGCDIGSETHYVRGICSGPVLVTINHFTESRKFILMMNRLKECICISMFS